MTEVSLKEHYCSICSLQFHSTPVFDMHLSLVHEGTRRVEEIACKKAARPLRHNKAWITMLLLFMKEKSHSNVKFVTTAVLARQAWKPTLLLSIIIYSNVRFHRNWVWRDTLHQFMKKRNHFNAIFVTSNLLKNTA